MAQDNKAKGKDSKSDSEAEVWNAISMFEQILEAMPNDRGSLEALAHAYEQVGDKTRAKEHLVHLANVLLEEQDADALRDVATRLAKYAEDDDEVKNLLSHVSSAASPKAEAAAAQEPASAEIRKAAVPAGKIRMAPDMSQELALAWNLLQAKELSEEEYANVMQDLTDMTARDAQVTASALHVLHDRGFRGIEKVVIYLSKECGLPIVSLTSFDLQLESVALLPFEFILRRGAIPFDTIGNTALIVIMNPYDKELMKDIEKLIGRKCYFYIALPSDFDAALERAKTLLADAAEAEEETL